MAFFYLFTGTIKYSIVAVSPEYIFAQERQCAFVMDLRTYESSWEVIALYDYDGDIEVTCMEACAQKSLQVA